MLDYKVNIPEYINERAFLDNPTDPSFISDLAFSMESDLDFLNLVCSFESEIPLNAAIQLSSMCGMEANKFVEVAKQTYYMLKQRAAQLIKYVCKIFLEFLRGTTDAKAVYKKYEDKLIKYSSEFDKMRPSFDENGSITVRNPRDRLSFTTFIVNIVCNCLDNILNVMHSEDLKKRSPIERVVIFSKSIQFLNLVLVQTDFNKIVEDKSSMIKLTDSFKKQMNQLTQDPNVSVHYKINEDFSWSEYKTNDIKSDIQTRVKELQTLFKKDYPTDTLNYKESYLYIRTMNEMILYDLFGIAKERTEVDDQLDEKELEQSKFKLPPGAKPAGTILTNNISRDGKDMKLRPRSYKVNKGAQDTTPKKGYVKMKERSRELDFKKLAKKIAVIEKEMLKIVDNLDNDKLIEENNRRDNMNETMKIIMNAGSQMAKVKDIIALSLSTFKGDMEVVLTENKKVGQILYQHKQ